MTLMDVVTGYYIIKVLGASAQNVALPPLAFLALYNQSRCAYLTIRMSVLD